jgi:hypothetical protein
MFDMKDFMVAAVAANAFVLPFVLALVKVAGDTFGVQGKGQLITSMVIGFVLGVATHIAMAGLPGDYPGYFALFLFGLLPGLEASGVYNVGKGIGEKAALKAAQHVEESREPNTGA